MKEYIPLDSIHTPTPLASPPSSWGQTIHTNFDFFHNPPGCSIRNGGAFQNPNNSWTKVPFDGADLRDTHGFHSATNNPEKVIVPPGCDGWYDLSFSGSWQNNATGRRSVRINWGSETRTLFTGAPYVGATHWVTAAWTIYCSAGTEIEVEMFQDSGGALSVGSCQLNFRWVAAL